MERNAEAYLRLKKACLPLIVAVQELAGSNLLSGDLQPLLEELRDAIRGAAREELVESLPIVTLPLYTIITTPAPQARPGKYQEVKTVALALDCVECAARQCGPTFIEGDPSIFLKFITHLTLRLATLSGEDSSKSVEWSTEERATLSTLRALCECRGPLLQPEPRATGAVPDGWDSGTKWTEVLRALVGAVNGAIVAQCIQATLDIAAKDKDRETRLLALSTLSSLLELLPCPELWRPFFPGVFGGLAKLVMGDFKQGSMLTSTALSLLLKTTALLTSDDVLRALPVPQTQAEQQTPVGGAGAKGASSAPPAWVALCAKLTSPQAPSPCPLPTLHLPIPPKLALPLTRAWVDDLCKRLGDFLPLVLRASRESPSAQVRLELVQGLSLLLRSSRLFLQTSGPLLRDVVDSVVGLQRDDVEQVARAAAELLPTCLGPSSLFSASPSWLVDRLLELFTCLPRLAVSASDGPLRSALDLLAGYLSLVGREGPGGRTMQQLLSTHLDALLPSLAQALAFDRSLNMQVIDPLVEQQQEGQGQGGARPATVGYYRHSLVHLREERCLRVVKDVLQLLGSCGGAEGLYVFVDTVLERVRGRRPREVGARLEWAMDRLPLIFILNHVILGAGRQSQSLLPALRLLLEELLGPGGGSVWRLRTCMEEGEEEAGEQEGEGCVALPAGVLDANGALVALLVESVGNAAQALGHEGFRPLLSLVLYPVLEKMGHGHPVVRQAALTTCHRLALLTGAHSIQRLVSVNLDYLVDALCARVRRSRAGGRRGAFPVRAGVLECLMSYTNTEEGQGEGPAMSLVREVAGLALSVVDVDGRTGGGQRYVNGMMRVLHAMVRNVAVGQEGKGGTASARISRSRKRRRSGACRADATAFWTQQIAAEFAGRRDAEPQDDGPQSSAADYFSALHEKKSRNGKVDGEGEELEADRLLKEMKNGAEEGQGQEDEEEDEDDKPTEAEALLIDILDRCAYFVTSPSLMVQHSVLGVMVEALHKLQGRRFVLLPTVHKVWPSLLARLRHCTAILQPARRPGVNEEHTPDSQRSSAQLVLIKVLEMVGCLAVLCGDYMSLKFTEELWPLLRRLLAAYQSKRATAGLLTADHLRTMGEREEPLAMLQGAASDKGSTGQAAVTRKGRQGLQVQGLLAILRCLSSFCESEACYMYTTPLVHDMGLACLYLLGRDEAQGSNEAMRLFRALLRLDGASLWPALMALAGGDVSARPIRWQTPLSTAIAPLPGVRDSGVQAWGERERLLAQGRAKALVSGMQDRAYRESAWCTSTA